MRANSMPIAIRQRISRRVVLVESVLTSEHNRESYLRCLIVGSAVAMGGVSTKLALFPTHERTSSQ